MQDGLLPDSAELRRTMIDRQVRTFDVTDQVIIGRMLDTPREIFVEQSFRDLAYSDYPVDLAGAGGRKTRTMLTPLVLARMLQAAAPKPGDKVLDIAGGAGYSAALFAGLAADVVSLESDAALSARASVNFAALGLSNARAVCSGLASPPKGAGPFDIIFVNGAIESGYETLLAALAPKGRLIAVMPNTAGTRQAVMIQGRPGEVSIRPLFDAAACPLEEFKRAPVFAL